MATNKVSLRSLPGADRDFDIELLGTPTSTAPYGFPDYTVDRGDIDSSHLTLAGALKFRKKKLPRRITFNNVILSADNKDTLNQFRESRTEIAVEPPWVDATEALTYLPLQKTLSDLREQDTRADVTFARSSARFNSVNGRKTPYGDPHYEDSCFGSGLHVSDVINDHHEPSYELRSYLTQDAEDSGATTLIYVTPAQAVLWDAYGSTVWPAGNKAYLMISTEEETTNKFELALISAINTTTGLVTLTSTDGGAALTNTASYLYSKRCYISSCLVSDCEMEDTGTGSWADDAAPTLKEKNTTMRETGNRCLRIISSAGGDGVSQVLGDVPADTDIVLWVRAKAIMKSGGNDFILSIYNSSDAASELSELITATDASWTWYKYAVRIAGGGAGQKTIDVRFLGGGAAPDEFLVDRVYIYQNCVVNGGMEPLANDTYDAEDAVTGVSTVNTVYGAGQVQDTVGPWDLALGVVGMIAVASGGKYGLVTGVNDGTDTVTVASWIGGAPANGETCQLHFAVAPAWTNNGSDPAADQLLQNVADPHSGTYAQEITVDAANEGIISTVAFTASKWFYVGMFMKGTGDVRVIEAAVGNIFIADVDATYTEQAAVYQATGANSLQLWSSAAAADFLLDDVMVVRLPGSATSGGPHDDAYYDLPEPLSTTGFTVFGIWRPDVANTSLSANVRLLEASRRTYDTNNRVLIRHATSGDFQCFVTGGGASVNTSDAEPFLADDKIYFAFKAISGGTHKAWIKIGTAATSTATAAAGAMPAGVTRLWLRGGGDYATQARGSLSAYLVENSQLSDANIEAIIDAFSGADADRLALLEETHGIIWRVESTNWTILTPGEDDKFKGSLTLVEVDRVGALEDQDA